MWIFNSVLGKIFEFLFYPFHNLSPWIGMIFISFLTGLFMLFVFRHTSNQQGIKQIKNKIKAHLLELRLYKETLSQSLKAQRNLLGCNLKYISYSAKPMLVMIIPLILIIIHLNLWFGYEPLSSGNTTLLKVKLEETHSPLSTDVTVEAGKGLKVDSPPLRIEENSEIDWRLLVHKRGVHDLYIKVNGEKIKKIVVATTHSLHKISSVKIQGDFIDSLLHPGESPIDDHIPIHSIHITYPNSGMNLWGFHIHWLVAYFVLSVFFGFAFKGVFKVSI
ncbi:hypothetical protein KGY73_03035 [bacterium]|nr:hypothetical protein [bacterium]